MTSSTNHPQPNSGVLEISAYVPGKSSAPEGVEVHKLSSNESPLGPSPNVQDAIKLEAASLEDYPDGSAAKLREAIGRVHGLNPDNIICGNGSDELLTMLAHAYLGPGDKAIYSEHGFLVYRIAILSSGAKPVIAPEKDLLADVDAILSKVTDKTKLVFLANPNNPTGTYLPIEEVRRLHAGLPAHVLLVLDAAYAEYVRKNDYESGIELVSGSTNVVMTRTFSKIHGLAGLRIGWAYAPANIVDAINRIRGPFNMNSMAIAAGAAAIEDSSYIDRAAAHNEKWLVWVSEALEKIGLQVTPSVGNFVLVHFPDKEGKRAPDADRFLTSKGYILRAVAGYGFANALRMTIGSEDDNRAVVQLLTEFLADA